MFSYSFILTLFKIIKNLLSTIEQNLFFLYHDCSYIFMLFFKNDYREISFNKNTYYTKDLKRS